MQSLLRLGSQAEQLRENSWSPMLDTTYDRRCEDAEAAAEARLVAHFDEWGGDVWTIGSGCHSCRAKLNDVVGSGLKVGMKTIQDGRVESVLARVYVCGSYCLVAVLCVAVVCAVWSSSVLRPRVSSTCVACAQGRVLRHCDVQATGHEWRHV